MQQTAIARAYRLRPIPASENPEQTVVVFTDPKASKKGSKGGSFELKKRKRPGQFYRLTLRQERGEITISEAELAELGLSLNAPLIDLNNDGEPVHVDGEL